MTSSQTDRLISANSSRAVKAPVRSVCTANITASGLSAISTIDGSLTPAADDRFLLAGQTSSVDNGIYVASSGTWSRATDFDTSRDAAKGTLIPTESGLMYRLTASNPITIGTTALTFSSNDSSTIVASLASTSLGAGASLVGLHDAGGLTSADDVEEVIAAMLAANFVTPIRLANASLAGHTMINGTITASVAASALTIAIKTLAGTDPSATDPVYILFRSATAATGDYSVITLTAATSLTVSSGSTLGVPVINTGFRIWVVGFNDGGTFRLGAINCVFHTSGNGSGRTVNNIYALGRFPVVSSTAEGGAGGADTAGVFYTGSAVTSKPYTVLGYFTYETGLATLGDWAAAPTRVELYHRGVPLPGTPIQHHRTQGGGFSTTTTTIPFDDTLPAITEGGSFGSITFTPSSAANVLDFDCTFNFAISAGSPAVAALFRAATTDCICARAKNCPTVDTMEQITLRYLTLAETAVATVFSLRAGPSSAGTLTMNGTGGARQLGGGSNLSMAITELMA